MTNNTQNAITDIPGIKVGHAQNDIALTGCTVILVENGAIGGVDQRGGAPGTRETDLLSPMHLVTEVHAILLAGGSAFGLDAAAGVMRYLEEHNIGIDTGDARVPIVPAAVIYDLGLGNPKIRPDAPMGYQACLNASSDSPSEGCVGAGTGAAAGKLLGIQHATKTGIGSASTQFGEGIVVGALVVVNPYGDVIDPTSGEIIAGTRNPDKNSNHKFIDSLDYMKSTMDKTNFNVTGTNTIIGVVATNAKFTKEEVNKVAQMAQDGIARTIRPSHTMFDGDTIFALATGVKVADVSVIGAVAADVFAQAILNGVETAKSTGELPN